MENKKVTDEELKTIIAKEIREKKLNDIVDIGEINKRVNEKLREQFNNLEELDNPLVARPINEFPKSEDEQLEAPTKIFDDQNIRQAPIGLEAGSDPLNQQQEPKMAITTEYPDFLKKVEPWKAVVCDFNEINDGGERLSNKPLRTFDNLDLRKTMNEMWSSEGKTKCEVFIMKFEKAGELEYDYKNGTTRFVEATIELPNSNTGGVYNENPYQSNPNKEVETYIKSNVNIDQIITDTVNNIIKNHFLTNTERAANNINNTTPPLTPAMAPVTVNNLPNTEHLHESAIDIAELTKVNSAFEKIETPQEIMEALNNKPSTAKLIAEGGSVKEWDLNGKRYYFLANQISNKKCYAKPE